MYDYKFNIQMRFTMIQIITDLFYKQREEFELSYADRDKLFSMPDGISCQYNIPYIDDSTSEHMLDIYRPEQNPDKALPVVINIHGGGLLIGNKEFNKYFCAEVAKAGFIVYSIEYRLIPDCSFFDQLDDVSRAFDYINGRISSDGGDSSNIYGCADSGGACLLIYATALNKSPALAAAAGVVPPKLTFNALGLISGMFYTNKFDKIGLFLPPYLYGSHYKKSAFAQYVNPEHKDIVTALPPCYLVTSHNDNLKNYTLNYEKALTKNNIKHKLDNFPKNPQLTHAFSVFNPFMNESSQVISSMTEFFKQH